jgi:hypothetical protein
VERRYYGGSRGREAGRGWGHVPILCCGRQGPVLNRDTAAPLTQAGWDPYKNSDDPACTMGLCCSAAGPSAPRFRASHSSGYLKIIDRNAYCAGDGDMIVSSTWMGFNKTTSADTMPTFAGSSRRNGQIPSAAPCGSGFANQ